MHPAERLERVDDRGASPGLHLVGELLFQTRQPFGVFGDLSDVFVKDDLLRRGGTDDLAELSEVGWAPGGQSTYWKSLCLGFLPPGRALFYGSSLLPCAPCSMLYLYTNTIGRAVGRWKQ